jgi:hypothetical protein
MSNSDGRRVCPECHGSRFSWEFTNIQFGEVYETVDGNFYEEALSNGPAVGSNVEEDGVFCTTCEEFRNREELVPEEED